MSYLCCCKKGSTSKGNLPHVRYHNSSLVTAARLKQNTDYVATGPSNKRDACMTKLHLKSALITASMKGAKRAQPSALQGQGRRVLTSRSRGHMLQFTETANAPTATHVNNQTRIHVHTLQSKLDP